MASHRELWASERMRRLTDKLWNCLDTVPEATCSDLDIKKGSSCA